MAPSSHPVDCSPESARDASASPTAADESVLDDKFRTANFMMYGLKIAPCCRQGRHPWSDCPYAHPTENARRRDPRLFSYSCRECPSYRNRGFCPKGDACEFSHGIFEARLHPDSFRTVPCKDGAACRRKICFFYHNEEERREPSGLSEARAQLAAEMGEDVLDLDVDKLRAVANDILTSSSSLSDTMASLSSSMSQYMYASKSGRSEPLSADTGASCALFGSGAAHGPHSASAMSSLLTATDTVAPCLKGANRNKAQLRQVADVLGSNAEQLMHSLRLAALHGELSEFSAAPTAPRGAVPDAVEPMLEDIAEREECSIGKLRGWLVRQRNLSRGVGLVASVPTRGGLQDARHAHTRGVVATTGALPSAAAMLAPAERARALKAGALTAPGRAATGSARKLVIGEPPGVKGSAALHERAQASWRSSEKSGGANATRWRQ